MVKVQGVLQAVTVPVPKVGRHVLLGKMEEVTQALVVRVEDSEAPQNRSKRNLAPDVLDSEPQDLSTVRRATDLALEHLRDSIRSTNDDMLSELGWTRKQAEAFLRRWENMQKASVSGSQGQQQAYEQTLRSLGLRTDRVRSSRNNVDDKKGVEVESRRTQPPYEYRERFKAFLKGASSRQVDVNE